ncbi:MAG: Vi polysaccharide biosynthesis UDP-N-acetylglucosaminuronic acid C-4 epimerase TviC [Acidimicrobiia bacterium]|nr:MAG: Vi polysaccharide biosynthesis UDP-N-acetylglucosaminuronic acid C-4 epimerase TviC [Acidimicrobiia bacterium]
MPDAWWQDNVASSNKRWLVTGAAGFIGSHLVDELLRLGQEVIGFDDFSTGYRHNLDFVKTSVSEDQWRSFTLVRADIRDFDACVEAAAGVDFVLHEAALGSVPRSMKEPRETHTVNVDGTMNVFLASLGAGVRKVVYASSSSVYGDEPSLPKVENRIGRPLSPYAASKQIGELYANTLWRTHELPTVGLRYFNVVGPRQDPEGPYAAVVPRWVAAMRSGHRPTIYGDGETSRDFCPVANAVQANLLAAVSDESTNGNAYNVALGGRTTLNELFIALRDALAADGVNCTDTDAIYEDFRPGDIRHSLADITKAQRDFGYKPDVTLEEGLAHVVLS